MDISLLLLQPDDMIKEQCLKLGSADLSRFVRTNKRIHGLCKDLIPQKRAQEIVDNIKNSSTIMFDFWSKPNGEFVSLDHVTSKGIRSVSINLLDQKYNPMRDILPGVKYDLRYFDIDINKTYDFYLWIISNGFIRNGEF